MGMMEKNAWATLEPHEGQALGKLIARLLADRHEYLDRHVYSWCDAAQAAVVKYLKLVPATTDT